MPNPSFLGYLTDPYLEDPYSGDTGLHSWGMQVELKIDSSKSVGMQVARQISTGDARGMQSTLVVEKYEPVAMQVMRNTSTSDPKGMQVNAITGAATVFGSQVSLVITDSVILGMQYQGEIKDKPVPFGMQVQRIIDSNKSLGMQVRLDQSLASWLCEELGYLETPYLEDPYLVAGICAQQAWQVARTINKYDARGMQVDRTISGSKVRGMQVELQIANQPNPVGMQVEMAKAKLFGMQTRLVLYNTDRLRILCDFPSRGNNGLTWSSTSTETGDFSPNNLNTDIVEEVWRSQTGTTSVVLTNDCQIPQGAAIDTMALLNHNLTTSATIVVEGSDSPSFATIEESFSILPDAIDAYYIAPTFPTTQSRYRRIIISDPTNPDGYLQIGTIVFGTSIIFQGENIVDRVTRRLVHFADKVPTEGFTNVTNDRALKKQVGIGFRNLKYRKGNYKSLRSLMEFSRTSLKCLWIPDPQDPKRFGTFGKLPELPTEEHRNFGTESNDLVDLELTIDESL